jgi:type II restriction/modification system DNA methylase subunit YeeA
MRLLFCLFAQDIGLMPEGLFTALVEKTRTRPAEFTKRLQPLFLAMATGGSYGVEDIAHFNGGLFSDDDVLPLSATDLGILAYVSRLDWASVEPAIFGTLFERSLDPSKRSQIGAHYTSRDDILLIVEPVLMRPLRRRWTEVQGQAAAIITRRDAAIGTARTRAQQELQALILGFADEIDSLRVLDPACGSGNFLYVALKQLLDLEKDVIAFAASNGLSGFFPRVGPEQLYGIELNAYAHELASVVVWIGYIQWLHDNGYGQPSSPILKPLHNIQHMDAIMARDESGALVEPAWPVADVIVGNPPFLGGKRLRAFLGDEYVDDLFKLYDGRVSREADLVVYWFERARALIEAGKVKRAGLLATQGIRGGVNRRVLQRIQEAGGIFMAWSDRPWVLDGAAVRVSMVGFALQDDGPVELDGQPVAAINSNLTSSTDLTAARRLSENGGLAYMGDTKGGPFELPGDIAQAILAAPLNPNGRPNSDVVRPWVNSLDITRRPRGMWIIDFPPECSEHDAALYEAPFERARAMVAPVRRSSRTTRSEWWLHERPRNEMRAAISNHDRNIVTPTVAKHRLFAWCERRTLPDHQLIVIARDDDYFFGVLHSRAHEIWALRMGTALEDRPRYTPTTTFETFPFPWPPGKESTDDPRVEAIAEAARELVQKRDAWLNASGLTAAEQQRRTLTNLYNQRPSWLRDAHAKLDRAVFAAYGWPADITDEEVLEWLLALNLTRTPA